MGVNRRSQWGLGLMIGSLIGSLNGAIGPVYAESVSPAPPVSAVAKLLEGVMDTTQQAASNPKAPSVRMTTCEIAIAPPASEAQPAIFLYQEQALAAKLDQPYRQRVLKLQAGQTPNTVKSLSFKPETPQSLIGLCNKPKAQRIIASPNLGQPICQVILAPQPGTAGFLGKTPAAGCPANYRGATRITNEIELFPAGMNTWDRGFDQTGKQVWGARSDAYEFRRPLTPP